EGSAQSLRYARLHGLRLSHRETLVDGDVRPRAHATVGGGPLDDDGVHCVASGPAEPEGQEIIDARLEAARRAQLLEQFPRAVVYGHLCAERESIPGVSLERHLEITVRQLRARVVAIHE